MKNSVKKHFDKVAGSYDQGKDKYSFYYSSLKNLLVGLIGTNKKVLEFGCGTGDLLASLNPKVGYGFDVSSEMIKIAKNKYKKKRFLKFSTIWPSGHIDFIFMSDVIEHLEDSSPTFKLVSKLMNKRTKFIITMANPLWEPLLMFWEKMGWKMLEGPHNRIKFKKLKIKIENAGLKIVKHDYKLLIPIKIPFMTNFANRYLEKYFKKLAFIEYLVAVRH